MDWTVAVLHVATCLFLCYDFKKVLEEFNLIKMVVA